MLESLFQTVPLRQFLDDFYLRLPLALGGQSTEMRTWASWRTIEACLAAANVDAMLVRSGAGHPSTGALDIVAVRRAVAEGYTLVVRHAERHDDRAAALAVEFRRTFAGEVNVHLYCTPAGRFGFGWHYDAEEVFILQTTGDKTYSLRKNTVNPWPLEESLPVDMQYEREIMPLNTCRLRAGDWLYVPSGYWHRGEAAEESISLAVGIRPTTGVDVYDFLRRQIVASLFWRRRLPPPGAAPWPDSIVQLYRDALREWGEDLARTLASPETAAQFLVAMNALRKEPEPSTS
jgi:ribosomal protein L16 Arg81 hydroxylase